MSAGGSMSRDELLKRDDLLKADLLSEVLLLGSGVAILVTLVIAVAAATSSALLQ